MALSCVKRAGRSFTLDCTFPSRSCQKGVSRLQGRLAPSHLDFRDLLEWWVWLGPIVGRKRGRRNKWPVAVHPEPVIQAWQSAFETAGENAGNASQLFQNAFDSEE